VACLADEVVSRERRGHHCGVAEEGNRGRNRLALVSVLATAAVGIAGAATTLLVSRDQRATEQANRIYDRRAAAYVAALDTFEKHVKVLSNLEWSRQVRARQRFVWEEVKVDDETDVARIRSRVLALGSTGAIAALDRVGALDRTAFALVFGEVEPVEPDPAVWRSKTDEAIQRLRAGLSEFERRLNRELTS
jgi:hypothetical protein